MTWDREKPDEAIISKNKELIDQFPWMEITNIYTGEGFEGEAKYYLSLWNEFDDSGWKDIWHVFLMKVAEKWKTWDEGSKKAFRFYDAKEKYGKLRVSFSRTNDVIDNLKYALEEISNYTCILCGKQPRDSRGGRIIWIAKNWRAPYCKSCAKSKIPYKKKLNLCYDRCTHRGPFKFKRYDPEKGISTYTLPDLEEF